MINEKNKYVEMAKEIVLNLVEKENVDVFLFGSRAGNNYRHDSDLDIGFIGNSKLDEKLLRKIRENIENSIIPYHIDLVDFSKVDFEFKKIALQNIEIWNKTKSFNLK